MIKVYYAYTSLLEDIDLKILKGKMAPDMLLKLERLKKESDRSLKLLSWYLLSYVLTDNGCDQTIDRVRFTPEGRPFFPGSGFDFNMSHSGSCAAIVFLSDYRADNDIESRAAIETKSRVGIDIESITEINFSDFESVFTPDILGKIYSSNDPLRSFYRYWTMLESALKADGAGLPLISSHIPEIDTDYVNIHSKRWFYRHITFDPAISCCIASDKAIKEIVCSEVKLS